MAVRSRARKYVPLTLISFGGGFRVRRLVQLWSRMRTDTLLSRSDGVVVGGHGGGGSYVRWSLEPLLIDKIVRCSSFGRT